MSAHLINFEKRFADDVSSGAKKQTIRKRRARAIQQGDELRLYTGLRTNATRLLRSVPCAMVQSIRICSTLGVVVGADRLTGKALEAFAKADGFQSSEAMLAFFKDKYDIDAEPFEGVVIHWR